MAPAVNNDRHFYLVAKVFQIIDKARTYPMR